MPRNLPRLPPLLETGYNEAKITRPMLMMCVLQLTELKGREWVRFTENFCVFEKRVPSVHSTASHIN